ncbi:hypothetical protein HK097_010397, partial [Rhizophlyctis rosea]
RELKLLGEERDAERERAEAKGRESLDRPASFLDSSQARESIDRPASFLGSTKVADILREQWRNTQGAEKAKLGDILNSTSEDAVKGDHSFTIAKEEITKTINDDMQVDTKSTRTVDVQSLSQPGKSSSSISMKPPPTTTRKKTTIITTDDSSATESDALRRSTHSLDRSLRGSESKNVLSVSTRSDSYVTGGKSRSSFSRRRESVESIKGKESNKESKVSDEDVPDTERYIRKLEERMRETSEFLKSRTRVVAPVGV